MLVPPESLSGSRSTRLGKIVEQVENSLLTVALSLRISENPGTESNKGKVKDKYTEPNTQTSCQKLQRTPTRESYL